MVSATAACPHCNSSSKLKFKTKDHNRKLTTEQYNYFQCSDCDHLLFLSPIPKNLADSYSNEYHYIPISDYETEVLAQAEQYKLDIVQQYIQSGRLLDIGPSWGGFAYLAKKNGFTVETMEMNPTCCKFLNDTLKIPTHQTANIKDILSSQPAYDVITLWQVIEHLPNPWETLDAIIAALPKGGILLIAAPNPSSFQFNFFKSFWSHLDAPRHIELIPISLLIRFLTKKGFSVLLNTTNDKGAIGWNKFGWEYSLTNFSTNKHCKKILSFLGQMCCKVFQSKENVHNAGSTYTLVFRKDI